MDYKKNGDHCPFTSNNSVLETTNMITRELKKILSIPTAMPDHSHGDAGVPEHPYSSIIPTRYAYVVFSPELSDRSGGGGGLSILLRE